MDNSSGQITAESISKFVGVPAKLISQDIVKIAQKEVPQIAFVQPSIFSQDDKILPSPPTPFSEPDWVDTLGPLINFLVAENPSPKSFASDDEATKAATELLSKLNEKTDPEKLHRSVLGLLVLVYTNPKAIENNTNAIKKSIVEKFPMDSFMQAAGSKLLLVKEKLKILHDKPNSNPYGFPPFQKALPFFPHYGNQVTLVFKDDDVVVDDKLRASVVVLIEALNHKCAEINANVSAKRLKKRPKCGYNIGFELGFWQKWCESQGMELSPPVKEATDQMENDNFMRKHKKLRYSRGDIWMYLKADEETDASALLKLARQTIRKEHLNVRILVTEAYKKSHGRLFGGQFLDGIVNAIDAVSMIREVLVPPAYISANQFDPYGSTFAFVQFFEFDVPPLNDSAQPISENMIGRDSVHSETLARLDERSHVKRARIIDPKDGSNAEFIRQPLPFVVNNDSGDSGPNTNGLFFVAFGQSSERFKNILHNILGEPKGFTMDLLMHNVQGKFGKLFYCPNANEISALATFSADDAYPLIPFWSDYASENRSLFYNHIQYLRTMSMKEYVHLDPPSDRILYLMSLVFSRWHSTWSHKFDVPRLFHLREFLTEEEKYVMDLSIQERKGYSYKMMLRVFTTEEQLPSNHINAKCWGHSENFGTYRIGPRELIVGVTDRLSFGSGKEVMPYLKEGSETMLSVDLALTEAGNMGHIVPGHFYMLKMGVSGILNELYQKLKQPDLREDQRRFYQSAYYAYEGVRLYLVNFARLATDLAKDLANGTVEVYDRKNLRDIADRMIRLAYGDPKDFTFHDALQMVFSMHCCLHLIGQAISVGRLDQLLIHFYRRDISNGTLDTTQAQELIDAFFVKFDEHAVLNRYNIPYSHTTLGSTCVTGRGGPFATGDSMNQWIQQVTVGGCDENGKDAFNDITNMCLRAARRLPLNAPCLSIRLTATTPEDIREEAAKALLSGGAHPILYHDRKVIQGLYDSLRISYVRSGIDPPAEEELLGYARDYSCDGCFEPMFSGRSEFKFGYIFVLKAIIFAINSGADYQSAGPLGLAGGVSSYKTPLAENIATFDEFKIYFRQHLKLMVINLYLLILRSYGNPWEICPSPMMSGLLDGCLDSGRDMTNGGSRFHILTPMYVGFTNAVNSLYNVKKIVYDKNDVSSLTILKMALMNNWGETMVEPFYDDTKTSGILHSEMWAQRYKDLREYALGLPKFGTDTADEEINDLAKWVATQMYDISYEALYEEETVLAQYTKLREKYDVVGKPFLFQVMSGSGTFENYVSVGAGCAATPDGRLNGQPVASDVSQQPYPQDRPVPLSPKPLDIIDTLRPYNDIQLDKYFPNGCEVDLTIPETFPKDALMEFINAFIKEETGSNLVTVTCIDALTMERARVEPQKFDLVRNRMGGWTNFFVSMFDEHQKQHARRPVFGPHKDKTCSCD